MGPLLGSASFRNLSADTPALLIRMSIRNFPSSLLKVSRAAEMIVRTASSGDVRSACTLAVLIPC